LNSPSDSRETQTLASEIADRDVRALFDRFVETYSNLHGEIRVQATSVEIRFFYKDEFLCRLAPYRELFHVQVGDKPVWETRVRTRAGFQDTIDRALRRFLRVYAAAAR
jgi:hypothetical protein